MADTLFIVPFQQNVWHLFYNVAMFMWGFNRAGLLAGAFMKAANRWVMDEVFGPGLLNFSETGLALLPVVFTIAVFLCGIGYALAPFFKIRVVEIHKAILWAIFAFFFFNFGPKFYVEFENFRQNSSSALLQMFIDSQLSASGDLGWLTKVPLSTEDTAVGPIVDNFAPWIDSSGNGVGGLDIAMAFVLANGADVVTSVLPLPVAYGEEFFREEVSAQYYMSMDANKRIESLMHAFMGINRLWLVWVLIILGIFEQAINLCLTIAVGLMFTSMMIAVLFSFFQRTEIMAKSLIDLFFEMIIFNALVAILEAFIINLALLGTATLNPSLTIGTGIVASVLMSTLLFKAASMIMDSSNRLFRTTSQIVGGGLVGPGDIAAGLAGAAVTVTGAALTGGASLAATAALGAAGAGVTHMAGGNGAQTLGSALHGSDVLFNAAALGTMVLPDSSPMKGDIQGFYEGALTNRMMGPLGGLMFAKGRKKATADDPVDDEPEPTVTPHRPSGSSGGNGHGPSFPRLGGGGYPQLDSGGGPSRGEMVSASPSNSINPDREQDIRFDPADVNQIAYAVALAIQMASVNSPMGGYANGDEALSAVRSTLRRHGVDHANVDQFLDAHQTQIGNVTYKQSLKHAVQEVQVEPVAHPSAPRLDVTPGGKPTTLPSPSTGSPAATTQ